MKRITKNHPYYQDFVELWNKSVEHDNKIGKCDAEYAMTLARNHVLLSDNIPEWHLEPFMKDFQDFYYHMFD